MRVHTNTISVSFVVWPLENFVKLDITVTKKPKNSFKAIASTFKSNLKILKVSNWMSFLNLRSILKFNCFAMFLKEDGSAETFYLSQASFPTKIYMNVYQNHLSYIKDIKMYSNQYICSRYDKVSTKMSHHLRHQSKCDGTVKYVFLVVCTKINCPCLRNWRKWA